MDDLFAWNASKSSIFFRMRNTFVMNVFDNKIIWCSRKNQSTTKELCALCCGNSGQILSSDDVLSCPLCTSSEGNDSTLFVNNEASTDSIVVDMYVICSSENKLGVSCPHCKQLVSCTGCYQQLHQTCPNCREEWRIF